MSLLQAMMRNQNIMACLLQAQETYANTCAKSMIKLELIPEQCLTSSGGMRIGCDKEWRTGVVKNTSLPMHACPTAMSEDELSSTCLQATGVPMLVSRQCTSNTDYLYNASRTDNSIHLLQCCVSKTC